MLLSSPPSPSSSTSEEDPGTIGKVSSGRKKIAETDPSSSHEDDEDKEVGVIVAVASTGKKASPKKKSSSSTTGKKSSKSSVSSSSLSVDNESTQSKHKKENKEKKKKKKKHTKKEHNTTLDLDEYYDEVEEDDASLPSLSTRSARRTIDSSGTKTPSKKTKKTVLKGDTETPSSTRSSKSTRGKRSIPIDVPEPLLPSPTTKDSVHVIQEENGNESRMEILKVDNEALMAETADLRKQLQKALATASDDLANDDVVQLRIQVSQLTTEVQEYEAVVTEKDNLIKKLTSAVDAQMDKVEFLEIKLQRAEQEFCVMEDELQDLENELTLLKTRKDRDNDQTLVDDGSVHSDSSQLSLHSDAKRKLERQLQADGDDKAAKNRKKANKLRKRERELQEREERLIVREAAFLEHGQDLEIQREYDFSKTSYAKSSGGESFDIKENEIFRLKNKITKLETTIKELQQELAGEGDTSEVIAGLKECLQKSQVDLVTVQNENKRAHEVMFAQEMERDIQMQAIQEGNNLLLQELYDENRSLQIKVTVLTEQNENLKRSIPEEGVDPLDHAMAGLQDEIAGLREKIVAKELEVTMRNDDISRLQSDIEQRDKDSKEMQTELLILEAKWMDTKAVSNRKIKQRDDTIVFMQNEMVRILKEKSEEKQKNGSKERDLKEAPRARVHTMNETSPCAEDEELARIQAFNAQLAELDNENHILIEELEKVRYQHGLQIKEKEARILEIEEEVADLNYEMKARKEADYVSLLKDRKALKMELEQTKKALKTSEEHVGDLHREIEHLKQHQDDLEHDVGELNKSLVSRDSGDYVSGLKRQIRSLKEHNMTLERKIEIETDNTRDVMASKDAKLMALQKEVRDLKYPGTSVVRNMLGFAKGGVEAKSGVEEKGGAEDNLNFETHHLPKQSSSDEQDVDVEKCSSSESPRAARALLPKGASLWSAIMSPFGQKRTVSTDLDDKELPAEVLDSPGRESVGSEGSLTTTPSIAYVEDDTPSMACDQSEEHIISVVATNSSNEARIDPSVAEDDKSFDVDKNKIDRDLDSAEPSPTAVP